MEVRLMIRFINKKKARNELKKVWTAHQNLNANFYDIKNMEMFAEGMASLAVMLGITDIRPPCYRPRSCCWCVLLWRVRLLYSSARFEKR